MNAPGPERAVARTLRAAARRLAWRAGLARAGWTALGAVLLVEVGAAAPPGSAVRLLALGAGGLAALAVPIALIRAPRCTPAVAAAVLDARLERGGLLAAAAEASAGAHARFAAPLLAQAAAALEGVSLGRLLPLRPPPGLLAGAAAAVLLPLVLAGGAEGADALPPGPAPISLLSPEAAGGGASEPGAADEQEPVVGLVPVPAPSAAEPASDPFAALPLDVADALRAQLGELAETLPRGEAPPGAAPGEAHAAGEDALARALAAADGAAAREAVAQLAQAARGGDRAAAAALAELAERVGAAGEGAAAGPELAPLEPATGPGVGPGPAAPTSGRRARPPWLLREASRRYFTGG